MKVSVRYAESDLTEFLPSPHGEETETSGNAQPHQGAPGDRFAMKRGLWGAGKGEIRMAVDWDPQETNEEIAALFNEGPIFPGESGA